MPALRDGGVYPISKRRFKMVKQIRQNSSGKRYIKFFVDHEVTYEDLVCAYMHYFICHQSSPPPTKNTLLQYVSDQLESVGRSNLFNHTQLSEFGYPKGALLQAHKFVSINFPGFYKNHMVPDEFKD